MWALVGCAALVSGAAAGAEVGKFSDDFSNYGFLSDGSPVWVKHSGNWEMVDGVFRQTDDSINGCWTFLDKKSFSDCQVKVKFNPSGNAKGVRAAGVIFRAKDFQHFYWIHFDSRNSQVVLAKHTPANSWGVLQRAPKNKMPNGQWHTAEITAVGNKITAKLNGKTVIEKIDNSFPAGRVGLRCGQGNISFDDFEVTGRIADDSKFVMQQAGVDNKTQRLDVPRQIVAQNKGYFPVLVGLGGQQLGAVIRSGSGHVGKSGRLEWISSKDGGKSWSQPVVIADSPVDDRNPAAYVTKDGKIAVLYSEASTYNAAGHFDINAGTYDLYITESTDGGQSWSPKRQIVFPEWKYQSVYGQGIVLSNGDILVPWYWGGGGFIRSTDGGKSWQKPQIIMRNGCSEVAFVEIKANEILAVCRADGLFVMRSLDNGKSWDKPVRITGKGEHPASVIKLADGRLFMTYGHRNQPYGVKIAVSSDNGQSWKKENTAFVSYDSASMDCGYPSAVQLADGSVAIICYAVGSKLLPWDAQAQLITVPSDVLKKLNK